MAKQADARDVARRMQTAAVAPFSEDVEEAVLGGLLINPQAVPNVASVLMPDDFFIIANAWILEAVLDVWRGGGAVDAITVAERLREVGRLEEIGGPARLTQVINRVPMGFDVMTYAHLVQRTADRRRGMMALSDAAMKFHDESLPVTTAYTEALQALIDAKPRALDQHLTPGASIADRFLELQGREPGEVTVFPLPFKASEKGLPFMTGGKLFGIGGDEKTGKSALVETLAEHWATLGLRGFFIHTEEKPDAKILRRYSRWSRIPFLTLEAGTLTEPQMNQRAEAITYTSDWEARLDLWYESLPTPKSIVMLMRRAVEVFRAKFIVLDNFTDVKFDPRANAALEATRLLQEIDDIAARYSVLIVLTTQMTTTDSGKRIAYGTSGFNQKMTWFWDINRKMLKEPVHYQADGELFEVGEDEFDPRVDIYVPASRYGRGAKIPVFADLRRFYWRDRTEVKILAGGPDDSDALDDARGVVNGVYRGGE